MKNRLDRQYLMNQNRRRTSGSIQPVDIWEVIKDKQWQLMILLKSDSLSFSSVRSQALFLTPSCDVTLQGLNFPQQFITISISFIPRHKHTQQSKLMSQGIQLQAKLMVAQLFNFLLVGGFMILTLYINKLILSTIIFESSKEIFQRETRKQLNQGWILKFHTEQMLEGIFGQMEVVSTLQTFLSKTSDFTIVPPLECLKQKFVDKYCYNASQCYGIFNRTKPVHEELALILNVTALLTEYRYALCLEEQSPLYYSHVSPAQLMVLSNEGFVFPPDYLTHSRPWYLEYWKSGNQSRVYGAPYQIPSGEVRVPIIKGLRNHDIINGVISKHVDFVREIKRFEQQEKVFYMVNKSGTVIYGKQYLSIGQKIFNVFEESLTGFNSHDWSQILAYMQGRAFTSDCENLEYLPQESLCLRNKKDNMSTILQSFAVAGSPFSMLLYNQDQKTFKEQSSLIRLIQEEIDKIEHYYYLIIAVSSTAVAILTYIMIKITLSQTEILIEYTHGNLVAHTLKAVQQKTRDQLIKMCVKSSTVNNLFYAIDRIIYSMTRKKWSKCQTCREFEQLKHPKKLNLPEYPIVDKLINHLYQAIEV